MVKPSSGAQDNKFPELQEPEANQAGAFKIRPCKQSWLQDGSLLDIVDSALRL